MLLVNPDFEMDKIDNCVSLLCIYVRKQCCMRLPCVARGSRVRNGQERQLCPVIMLLCTYEVIRSDCAIKNDRVIGIDCINGSGSVIGSECMS